MKSKRYNPFRSKSSFSMKGARPSQSATALMQDAMAHLQSGRLQEAEALYLKALQVSPNDPDALHLLGVIAHQGGKYELAVELIDKSLEANPQNAAAYSNRANVLQELKRHQAALESCEKAILLCPNLAEAHNTRGNALLELKQYDQALASYDKAISLRPNYVEAYANRGNVHLVLKDYQAAVENYDRAILLNPNYAKAYNNRANALLELKQFHSALESYDKAILLNPDVAGAHSNRGNVLSELKQFRAALESCERAILLNPNLAEAHNNRGNALLELKQFQSALESCDKAILLDPNLAEAYNNRGNALLELKRCQTALQSYDKAILLRPEYEEAYANRGNALLELKEYQFAVESYDNAIRLNAKYVTAHYNRGNALLELKRYQAALESYDKAILLDPGYVMAYNNRGNALLALKRYQTALESYDKVILLDPNYVMAYNNRGNALQELKQHQAALESYDKAILLKPDLAEAYANCGNTRLDLKQYQAALESYEKVAFLSPGYEYLHGRLLYIKQMLCAWDDHDNECKRLEMQIGSGQDEKASQPFDIISVIDSPSLQRKAAEVFAHDKHPARPTSGATPKRTKHDKIRIGYFSADYFDHATCYLIAELFELHDKSKFEILGFSYGPETNDGMRRRVAGAMDRFEDVRSLSDEEVAQLSRSLEVDIAVDLKGFTRDSRTGIFAERAAPIQVSYLGYPGTMGAAYMDYLVADRTVIPEDSQQYYSEKIVYLPGSYQVNDSKRSISAKTYTRAEEGLPETGFVYCCFNNNYKITPGMFDIWMRILGRVEGSVLWLLEDNPVAGSNLRKEAARRGVSPERLIFAGRRPLSEHLGRHRLADLFLDTFPCNAHTTASDALWAGLPVLTRMGQSFPSRVAASLLRAIDLPELVVMTDEDYEALAVEIAVHPERSRELRDRLHRNRLTTPLFDVPRFTGHLEAAYMEMYGRFEADMKPENIHVEMVQDDSRG